MPTMSDAIQAFSVINVTIAALAAILLTVGDGSVSTILGTILVALLIIQSLVLVGMIASTKQAARGNNT